MRSVFAGFGALSNGKLVFLLALTAVVLGLFAASPLYPAFSTHLGATLAGDDFVRNQPTFAPTDFFDFLREGKGAIAGTNSSAHLAALLGILLQAFLAGGIVAVLGRGEFTFGQLLEPARRNFWHNVKCLFGFAILLVVVLGGVLGGAVALGHKLLEHAPPDSGARAAWRWGTLILAVLLWGVLSLLYDFARAARRYAPSIGAWRAWGFARRALRAPGGSALGLYLFWLIVGAAAWLGGFAVTWTIQAESAAAIAVLFFLQFVVIWIRAGVRVATWGSYLDLLDRRAAFALAKRAVQASAPPSTAPAY